jgi:hypothetical protein
MSARRRSGVHRRGWPAFLFVIAVAAAVVASCLDSGISQAASGRPLSILVMGDSYSAGNGAGEYLGQPGCFRSARNYARRVQAVSATG